MLSDEDIENNQEHKLSGLTIGLIVGTAVLTIGFIVLIIMRRRRYDRLINTALANPI